MQYIQLFYYKNAKIYSSTTFIDMLETNCICSIHKFIKVIQFNIDLSPGMI